MNLIHLISSRRRKVRKVRTQFSCNLAAHAFFKHLHILITILLHFVMFSFILLSNFALIILSFFFLLGLTPAPRSTYVAVQKGDIDIPISGLQKPAPQPRAHKGKLEETLLFNLIALPRVCAVFLNFGVKLTRMSLRLFAA